MLVESTPLKKPGFSNVEWDHILNFNQLQACLWDLGAKNRVFGFSSPPKNAPTPFFSRVGIYINNERGSDGDKRC